MNPVSKSVSQAVSALRDKMERTLGGRTLRLMEVCGTHTVAIAKSGLRSRLPSTITLLSGPGCPVCVTPGRLIDRAVALADRPDCVLASFGDMLRVPGSVESLEQARVRGARVRMVYSPRDALELARRDPGRRVVLFAVGFETTQPGIAAAALAAEREGLDNFLLLSALRLVPPALRALLSDPDHAIDGFILPGHVSAVLGTRPYQFIADEFGRPGVVAGFEPEGIMAAVARLAEMVMSGAPGIENLYPGVVRPEGNPAARAIAAAVFEAADAEWRGLGEIAASGLRLRDERRPRDALLLPVELPAAKAGPAGCRCAEVLQGRVAPPSCPLFGRACSPERPVGPCMVSMEGACQAYYRYGGGDGAGD